VRLKSLTLLIAGLMIMAVPVLAGDNNDQDFDTQANMSNGEQEMMLELTAACQVLDHSINLWHDATLKGNRKQASQFAIDIDGILAEDIEADKLRLKMLVRQVEMIYASAYHEGQNMLEAENKHPEIGEYRDAMNRLVGVIRVKEALLGSIVGTDAFSNRYRLLGDYVNLLRQELEMPKAKMAVEQADQPVRANK